MLKALFIKNYALIEELTISFNKGFSVITGETGAGKSILLGALSLILGKRADTGILKDKNKKCIVEGEFNIASLNLKAFFYDNNLDYEENTILRREIVASGKSRAFVNDTPVNLNILKELGKILVDIHSQHETLMLSDYSFQLETLDSYVKLNKKLEIYKETYIKYKALKKELEILKENETAFKRDEDYLKFQLDEFDKINLDIETFHEMEKRLTFLSHAGEITEALSFTYDLLTDNENNVLDKLSLLKDNLSAISRFLPKAEEFAERIDSVSIELKDISEEAKIIQTDTEFNPAELQKTEEILDEIYRLEQKHHAADIEELIEIKSRFEKKLNSIVSLEFKIEEKAKELENIRKLLIEHAEVLSKERLKGAPLLAKAIENIIKKLGMEDAIFNIEVTPLNNFSESGKDKIVFKFSANRGIPAGDIYKIASGGELSRLMLAIKSLITENSLLPTVIFDEIDSGISGDIAGKAGNIMKKMSKHHQLLVITHLPQIAAKADEHFKVYKKTDEDITKTNIKILNYKERIDEIAVMLSDENISNAAKNAAKELLKQTN
jgi:DNA repair protein RecN (Recombination protein N)